MLLEFVEGESKFSKGPTVVRVDFDSSIQSVDGLVVLFEFIVNKSELANGPAIVGIKFDSPFQSNDGLVVLL